MKKRILFFLLSLSFCVCAEIVDTYPFKNTEDRIRAVALAKSLRCPQCQNQNLVESNSPIAYDLRIEVYKMIDEGKSNQQIIDVMTTRFDNFVLYKPPLERTTLLLWGLPFVLLLFSSAAIWHYLRRRTQNSATDSELNAEQRQALERLLQQHNRDNTP